jgi:hypothetical protein
MSNPSPAAKPTERPIKAQVTVSYNGIDKAIDCQPNAAMQALLEHALNAFGVHDNRHVMALWTEPGAELPNEGSAEDAGVHPGEVLILRPSAVRGGCC